MMVSSQDENILINLPNVFARVHRHHLRSIRNTGKAARHTETQRETESHERKEGSIDQRRHPKEMNTMKRMTHAPGLCAAASRFALVALVVAMMLGTPGAEAELISTPAAQPADEVGDGWCARDIHIPHTENKLTLWNACG